MEQAQGCGHRRAQDGAGLCYGQTWAQDGACVTGRRGRDTQRPGGLCYGEGTQEGSGLGRPVLRADVDGTPSGQEACAMGRSPLRGEETDRHTHRRPQDADADAPKEPFETGAHTHRRPPRCCARASDILFCCVFYLHLAEADENHIQIRRDLF